jgi:mRNA-degrading endonuclease RelE of RelBE toxin-antitoxin system
MICRLDMDAEVRVLISHMAPGPKRKIRESLRAVASDPLQGKPLQDDLAGLHSYRVGSLRIVYSIDRSRKAVHVVAIGPRKNVYAELERAVRVRKSRT